MCRYPNIELCGFPVAVASAGAHWMGLFVLRKLRHDGHHSQTSHLGESSKLKFNCEWATLLGPSISGNYSKQRVPKKQKFKLETHKATSCKTLPEK